MFRLIILLTVSTTLCSAVYDQCSTNTSCPTGGLWSEWVSTDNCSASCGSCAKQLYTRTCVSEMANCNCSGDSSLYLLCNTAACTYPSQKTCCTPYVPMLLNGSFQCGPLLKDTSSNTTSCCPWKGIWSAWSGFSRTSDNSAWIQTRQCLSEAAGCPCTGNSSIIQTACPCRAMQFLTQCQGSYNYMAFNGTVNDTTCEFVSWLKVRNEDGWVPCNARSDGTPTTVIRYNKPSNASLCLEDRPLSCNETDNGAVDGWQRISFTCDTTVLYWKYDYTGDYVNGFLQIDIVNV